MTLQLNRFLLLRFVRYVELIPDIQNCQDWISPLCLCLLFLLHNANIYSQDNHGITESKLNLLHNENIIKLYSEEKYIVYFFLMQGVFSCHEASRSD